MAFRIDEVQSSHCTAFVGQLNLLQDALRPEQTYLLDFLLDFRHVMHEIIHSF